MRETKRERVYRFYQSLERLGIDVETADKLRRIEMTLSRWSELECGDSNAYASWAIEREEQWAIERAAWPLSDRMRWWDGEKWNKIQHRRTYSDYERTNGIDFPADGAFRDTGSKPYMVRHVYPHNGGSTQTVRTPIADREKGALKRLAAIMAAYPGLVYYHQGDPRGCALWLIPKDRLSEGERVDSVYTRGVAVCVD